METLIFDENSNDLQQALDVHAGGGKLLCAKCGAELIVVSNRAEAKKTGNSPGIVCPVDKKHIERRFILAEDFLAFNQIVEEMKKKANKNIDS